MNWINEFYNSPTCPRFVLVGRAEIFLAGVGLASGLRDCPLRKVWMMGMFVDFS